MRVLFLMISYPDVARNTNMYTDLTNEFLKNGHDVYVAAPDNNLTKIYNEEGIKVLRIKTLPLFNTSIIRKGIANLLLPYQYKRAIIRYFKNICFDLVVTPTPPITFIGIASFLKKKYNAKIYLILRDIFPQNAKDLGIIKNSLLFRYFRNKEKKLYNISDTIGCMSHGNIEYVLKHNPEVIPQKLHILPNWIKKEEFEEPKSNIKTKYGLDGKFVAIFGGNIGLPQRVDFIIDVADRIKKCTNIIFLLIGEGTEKEKIKNLIKIKKLNNVILIDLIPQDDYINLTKQCDVGLVNLSEKFTIPNIPCRTLSYWKSQLPVLAALDKITDLKQIIESINGGLCSMTGDIETYIKKLMYFYNNPEQKKIMGKNGFNYAFNFCSEKNAYSIIIAQTANVYKELKIEK